MFLLIFKDAVKGQNTVKSQNTVKGQNTVKSQNTVNGTALVNMSFWPGNTNWMGRYCTINLLIRIAGFVEKYTTFLLSKALNSLNWIVQGGQ